FRIEKASLINSRMAWLISAVAPFAMTRRLPLPARRSFASNDNTTGSRSGLPGTLVCNAAAIFARLSRTSIRSAAMITSSTISRTRLLDFRDAEAIAEAVQRPTMKFVATKTSEQLDLQALHRVRERLVSQRTGIINQIRAFLLERGFAVRQGQRFLRAELPRILAAPCDALSPRMLRCVEPLSAAWRRLDARIPPL